MGQRRFDGWEIFVAVGSTAALIWCVAISAGTSGFLPALGAALIAAVAVALRTRQPTLAISLAVVASVIAGFVDTSAVQLWVVAQLVLLSVALSVGRRRSIGPAVLIGGALFACVTLLHGEYPWGGAALGVVSWTLGVWGLAAAISSARREAGQWQDHARHLQRTREEEIRRHIVEERLRIARDLHDELGHEIAVIGVNAGAAEACLSRDPDSARASLKTIRDSTRRVLAELQQILGVLRSDQESSPPGTITELLDAVRSSGLVVHTPGIETERLAPDGAAAAYRVVQEALTNAGKHGSGAVTIETSHDDRTWTMTIQNPVGNDESDGTGFGLIGMRERVELAGGKLRIMPGDGTFRLVAELPLNESAGS